MSGDGELEAEELTEGDVKGQVQERDEDDETIKDGKGELEEEMQSGETHVSATWGGSPRAGLLSADESKYILERGRQRESNGSEYDDSILGG